MLPGSIFFLLTIYLFRESSKHQLNSFGRLRAALFWSSVSRHHGRMNSNRTTTTTAASASVRINRMIDCRLGCEEMGNRSGDSLPSSSSCSDSDSTEQQGRLHFGSFYLRLGAVAFGLGSMVYSGLEFGQFFELESKEQCYSFLYGFTPTSHMLFTFFQLYFIFMNSKSLIAKHRYLGKLVRQLFSFHKTFILIAMRSPRCLQTQGSFHLLNVCVFFVAIIKIVCSFSFH